MSSPARSPNPIRILLVDDQDIVRRSLALFIASQGWKAFAYDCDADVATVTRRHNIDVVVTDYRMPNVTGLDLIEILRDAGIFTPAMILSADVSEIDKERAKRLDVFRILAKPPDLKELARALIEAAAHSKGQEVIG